MKTIHEQTYVNYRNRLQALIDAALAETGRSPSAARLRHLAIACNAVIDGLWLEGGALPHMFEPGELPQIGLQSVGAIIALDLQQKEQQP